MCWYIVSLYAGNYESMIMYLKHQIFMMLSYGAFMHNEILLSKIGSIPAIIESKKTNMLNVCIYTCMYAYINTCAWKSWWEEL